MNTRSVPAEQISVVFEYVQGKRRLDRVLDAASTLLQRVAEEPDRDRRLELCHSLIRRHVGADVRLEFAGTALGTAAEETAEAGADTDTPACRFRFADAAGDTTGFLSARYTPDATLGLTPAEWPAAMRLLARVTALAAGGRVV
ncbi:hypothetical protein ADL22_15870 [Streptomyces sp. NRRL F-4489]|uniref:hypothetical protein n=1 Tax=Streptomyces sp. NRRL F-4489 TaxID=1609095 RepID=UPI00074A93AA|nr:hypothetical protein [Streptomyces sp. NRRL F-4489]KUL39345.1 hypothetical protein ADL22_15870 [Streptomyces sp. NRRL F-4489]